MNVAKEAHNNYSARTIYLILRMGWSISMWQFFSVSNLFEIKMMIEIDIIKKIISKLPNTIKDTYCGVEYLLNGKVQNK